MSNEKKKGMRKRKDSVASAEAPVCTVEKLGKLSDVVATGGGESEKQAKQEIQKFDGARMYLMHLVQLVLNPNCHVELRSLASANLKKIVEAQWCSTAESFLPPEIDSREKEKIRALLLEGLQESNSEVREAAADAISKVVKCDSPDF